MNLFANHGKIFCDFVLRYKNYLRKNIVQCSRSENDEINMFHCQLQSFFFLRRTAPALPIFHESRSIQFRCKVDLTYSNSLSTVSSSLLINDSFPRQSFLKALSYECSLFCNLHVSFFILTIET